MMKRNAFKLVFVILVFVLSVAPAGADVKNTVHNFSFWSLYGTGVGSPGFQFDTTKVCIFCHTPHHAAQGMTALWNRSVPNSATFTLYSSSTLQAVQNLDTTKMSLMCLSCHDGVTAINTLLNTFGDPLTPVFGADQIGDVTGIGVNIGGLDDTGAPVGPINDSLRNDHPVGFSYTVTLVNDDRTLGGFTADQLSTPDNTNGYVVDTKVRLFGPGKDMLECGTCHDPHDNTFGNFLVKSNVNSALCVTCHLK